MPKPKITDDERLLAFVATAPIELVETTLNHAMAVLKGRKKQLAKGDQAEQTDRVR